MTKRQFNENEVQSAIQKSAKHCAAILQDDWTPEELIEDLKNGGTTYIAPENNSFAARGTANSKSQRLEALKDAVQGEPRHQWLHHWTRNS